MENQTDSDWNDVQLSLVSGRPLSFIQDLYQPLFVPRPVVQPQLYASLRPQTYDAGMRSSKGGKEELKTSPQKGPRRQMQHSPQDGTAAAAAIAKAAAAAAARGGLG